ncbi:MAG TPA: UbiD family decarboxylase [Chloroflexota bacterium]|nr:UbiD family decarboxylase [Chloroflexota bacterium]
MITEASAPAAATRATTDLRDWLARVEALGQLKRLEGAHWDLELGGISELMHRRPNPQALLFDAISGYPRGRRVLTNMLGTVQRLALTTGTDPALTPLQYVEAWRHKIAQITPIEPEQRADGPVLQNVREGAAVNLLEFPVPRWHEHDGGRYIGTACLVITRDPEDDWVNVGTYRVMVHDERTLGCNISPGKHGRIQRQKYLERGEPCPVAMSFGQHPLLFLAACTDIPYRMNEYAWVGGVLGEPVPVIPGPRTGLPIPAYAEIAIEGAILPDATRPEGPFGEWTGYYASGQKTEPLIRVDAVYFRNDPILTGQPPFPPSESVEYTQWLWRAAVLWNQIEAAGVPDVKAVRVHPSGGRFLVAIAIRQRYPGHAKQAALVASQCRAGAYMGRYVIVVDDDIDIYDTDQLLWALATRSDPAQDIDIIRRAWSGPLDPAIPPGQKGFNSRAIIDATRPWEWREQFPPVSGISPALRQQLEAKWGALLDAR